MTATTAPRRRIDPDVIAEVCGVLLVTAAIALPSLRAYNVIDWAWWIAFAPLWFVGGVFACAYLAAVACNIADRRRQRRSERRP